jgi:hypothetical protein
MQAHIPIKYIIALQPTSPKYPYFRSAHHIKNGLENIMAIFIAACRHTQDFSKTSLTANFHI